jgi:hypothetical protein
MCTCATGDFLPESNQSSYPIIIEELSQVNPENTHEFLEMCLDVNVISEPDTFPVLDETLAIDWTHKPWYPFRSASAITYA